MPGDARTVSVRAQALAKAHGHEVDQRAAPPPVAHPFVDPIATLPVKHPGAALPKPRGMTMGQAQARVKQDLSVWRQRSSQLRTTYPATSGTGAEARLQAKHGVITDRPGGDLPPRSVAQLYQAESALPIPPAHVFERMGQELIGMGPGMVNLAKGEGQDVGHAARGDLSFPNTKAFGKGLLHSYGETIHHPYRQIETDPLGFVANLSSALAAPGSIAGRVGAAHAAEGVGSKLAAAVKRPPPVERTLEHNGVTVHPLASKNHTVGLIQKHVVDRATQKMLDKGEDTLTGRLLGPNVKFGRELRSEERFRTALNGSAADRLSHYGGGGKARSAEDALAEKARAGKLTAAQQKAVQIAASGRPAEVHVQLERNAVQHFEQQIPQLRDAAKTGGKVAKQQLKDAEEALKGHRVQLGLSEAAVQHVDHPLVQAATRDAAAAIGRREDIRGMTEDEIAHRVGAHATQIGHLATSPWASESPVETLARLEAGSPVRGASLADAAAQRGSLIGQLGEHARTLEAEIKATETHGEGKTAESVTAGKLSALRTQLDQVNEAIDREQQIENLHAHLIHQGHQVRQGGGFYLPLQDNLRKTTRGGMGATARASVSDYGVAAPKGEASHQYLGRMVRKGTYRTDATVQVGRALRDTERLASAQRVHAKLYQLAHDHPQPGDIPIREKTTVPDWLKRQMNTADRGDLVVSEHKPDLLAQTVESWFDPSHVEPGEGVKYIPANMVKPLMQYVPKLGTAGEFLDRLNQIPRIGRFLRPGYLQWFPQNLVVNTIQQGPLIIRNAKSLVREVGQLKPDDYDKLAALAGTGVSHALEGDTRWLQKTQHGLASFWAKTVDHVPRMLALLHELHAAGYHNADQWTQLLHDAQHQGSSAETTLIQAAKRANKEAIDYGAITNGERATLKKFFTSWPWMSAASRWVSRLPVEHPYQFEVYGHTGEQGADSNEKFYEQHGGTTASYLESSVPTKHAPFDLGNTFDTNFLNPGETAGSLLESGAGFLPEPSHYRGDLAGELAAVPTAIASTVYGITKYGSSDKSGNAPWMQLLKAFQPAGAALLIGKGDTGTEPGGWQAALERYTGLPFTKVNWDKAAKSGLLTLTEKGRPGEVADAKFRINDDAIAQARKAGKISGQDAADLHRSNVFARRVAEIENGVAQTKLSTQQDREIAIAQAAFNNETLASLNQTLSGFGLPPATQADITAEHAHLNGR